METTNAVIAVCDDEQEIRNSIESNIRLIYKNADIVHFCDGKSLIEYAGKIDIIFLDIQMSGVSGMEAARELRRRGSKAVIVFTTAIEEYVYEAFEVDAFRYLVKPLDKIKFFEVLRAAVEAFEAIKAAEVRDKAALLVKTGSMTRKIYFYEISYLEIFNRKVVIHRADDEIEFYGKLIDLEKRLSADFVRCHRSYIVNLRYVSRYDSCSIVLEDGTSLPLPQKKYADFVREYMKYTDRLAKEKNNA